jgi:hypothetical protein
VEQKYTAQQIKGTNNGWMLTENETGKKQIVFCRAEENTAEAAIAVIVELQAQDAE